MFCGGLSFRSFVVVLVSSLAAWAPPARAAFEIIAHDVSVDAANRRTTFTLTFNQPPDFFTTDALDRPTHGFQFFYDREPTGGEIDFAGEDVVIIRGVEIHVDNTIPIRESLNPDGVEFPNAEGWGRTIGEVDYELAGQVLSFRTSWDLLHESDEDFGYRLNAFEQGELTSEFTFLRRILVPLPSPLLAGVGMLGLSCVLLKMKRI